jgi:hypothetical protein
VEENPGGFDEAEYERKLERWALSALPTFRIEGWSGTWSGSASGTLCVSSARRSRRPTRSVVMTRTITHRQPDSSAEIRVSSSRPDVDEVSHRHSALTNMAIQIVRGRVSESATADEYDREVFQLADRLQGNEYAWTTAVAGVDGANIELDVLTVGEVWVAFGSLNEDVRIDLEGRDIPFAVFRLEAIPEAELSLFAEDTRWSTRAEDFLMARRWVPNFVVGWPTWFGNRKASGIRGLPGDLAYLRDSLFKRSDSG